MSLFSRLLNLNTGNIPLEDFFTELVAYLFTTDQEILTAWLKQLNLLDLPPTFNSDVSTQREFKALKGHHLASRPDISVELWDSNSHSAVLIESKIGSHEGYKQLSRYLEILHQLPGFQQKLLLYITRDFDPKNQSQLFKDIPNSTVKFEQLRWHQFYRFLRAYKDKLFVQEILTFMEEHQMSHNNQFSSIDAIAMTNFPNSLRMMEEIMWGEVEEKFKNVLGGVKKRSTAMTQIKWHGRYVMDIGMPGGWWCKLGFSLRRPNLSDYPSTFLMVEIAPNSSHRSETTAIMKGICEKYEHLGWRGYGLNNPNAWAGIIRGKNLKEFLSDEDHIASIKSFFLQSLDELHKIKSDYPNLPWGVVPENTESNEDNEELGS